MKEVIGYIKQIYSSKNALANHISLFSLVGIFVLCFSKSTSSWANSLFSEFFIIPPNNFLESWFYVFLWVLILLYLFGYGFRFINHVLNDGEVSLPDFTLKAFDSLVLMLPVVIFWGVYYLALFLLGLYLFSIYENSAFSYIYESIILCSLPFVAILISGFAKDYKYRSSLFSPLKLLKIIEKSLGDVIYLSLSMLIVLVVPVVVVWGVSYCSGIMEHEIIKFALKLLSVVLVVYFAIICQFVYNAGLAKISESKKSDI